MERIGEEISTGLREFVERDQSTQIARLQALVHGQARVLELVSAGASLPTILGTITLWVEEQSNNELFAAILIMDPTGKRLLHGAAPSLPTAYNEAVHGILIGPDVGTCGRAAYTKSTVIVEDMATNPLWKDYGPLALSYGLKASWSNPLIDSNGKVLGTFGIYYTEPRTPTEDDIEIIQLISKSALLAIQHHQSVEERKLLEANEKKHLEKIKEQYQHFYKLLMDAPAIIAVLKGPDHIYELTNPLYQQVVGGKRNLLGKPIREALPELEGQGIYELLDDVYKTGRPYIDNERLVKLDRTGKGVLEDVYFNFIFQAIRNEREETEGIFIHAVDITELVASKKRAEESEERFKSFVLNSPMPIGIYVGREMRIQTANDAILETWDRDKSVIGKTFREALPELEGQPFYQLLDDVYTSGRTYQATAERVDLFRRGKMEVTYYNFIYKALRDANGEIYGVINTGVEVTDLVQARQKLMETQENLRLAIDVAELGTWHVDVKTGMGFCSDQITEWFGLPHGSYAVSELLKLVDVSDQSRVRESLHRAIQFREICDVEVKVINMITGQERIIHARGKVTYDDRGEPLGINGTAIDITLVKNTELKLESEVRNRTMELEKVNNHLQLVNENLKQFAYVASHDLQEPLRKINIFSDMLVKKSSGDLDQSGKLYLDKISASAKRMSNLIRDLLEFSRVESKEKSFTPTDLESIVNKIKVDYELLINEKQASLTIGKLCTIEGVPLQMNQLFYNLIGNAIKFSKPGQPPQIAVYSRMLNPGEIIKYPRLNREWQYAEIIVEDKGIGFDQQFAEQIFVIFQRLHEKEKYEGTGIGLALCKKIVDNHEGEIFAESSLGQGSAFHVILPVQRG